MLGGELCVLGECSDTFELYHWVFSQSTPKAESVGRELGKMPKEVAQEQSL